MSDFLQKVEELSHELLQRAGIHCPPMPVETIMLSDEEQPIEVRLVPLTTHHGAIWHLKDNWIIQLKKDDPLYVRRFTLFHEAFHILAHRKATPVFSRRGNSEGIFNEQLADAFAAYTLMPAKWVRGRWAECKDINQMTNSFQVPKSTICVRLKVLGLT